MNIRRTVRDVHRRGTEDYAVVENVGIDTATVRLATGGKRLTNLPVISTVQIGDRVIVDYSTGKPYVRPVTLSDEEVVLDSKGETTGEKTQIETGRLWVMESDDYIMHGNYGVSTVSPDRYHIPDFTQVGGDGEVSPCPYVRIEVGQQLSPYPRNLPHLSTPGKYIMSTSLELQVGPNLGGLSFPWLSSFTRECDMYTFWISSHDRSHEFTPPTGRTDYTGKQRRYLHWQSVNDVITFHNCAIIVTQQTDTWAYPVFGVYRYAWPANNWFGIGNWHDYTISNYKCSVMKIANLSEKPRSTLYSAWDEWFEKYPEYL